jgi:menaquinone-dependent protoporphyrinogen oxidase
MIALVAYATKHGSTREVADAIGEWLRERGFGVDVMEAHATPADLSGYDLVVLGGALYIGRWHHDAVAFLKQHRTELASKPLAVFGMGPAKDEKPAFDAARVQLEQSLARAAVTPELTAVFGGVVQPKRLRFPFSWMPASDARDWAAIESFAKQAAELAGSRTSTDAT